MLNNAKNEAIIKMVGKISIEYPEIDQLKIRNILETELYRFDLVAQETSLVATDTEERIQFYIMTRKQEGLSHKTLDNYYNNLMIFARALRKPLNTITTTDMRVYLAARCKNMKPSTTNTQISTMKAFFKWLLDEEYIQKNPMTKIKQTKQPKRLRTALTDEEIENLRQNCNTEREKALVELIVSSGLRLSEVTQIDVKMIDWNERSITVIGKGNKERTVFFSTRAKILLKKYLKTRKGDSEALFIGEKAPHARLSNRAVEKALKLIAVRSGINKSIYPHLLRHTFATHHLNSGMSLPVLQKLMGHDSPETTLIYAALSKENIKHEYHKIN